MLPLFKLLIFFCICQINNLEYPHGQCNDSVQLQYFDNYTMSKCHTNCKQQHIVDQCGCRNIYMPANNGRIPVCDLQQYQDCLLSAVGESLESFPNGKGIQNCIPVWDGKYL